MTEERTPLQDLERRALTGNRSAVVQVISALRRYRAAVKELIENQYKDGERDLFNINAFAITLEGIENDVEEPT